MGLLENIEEFKLSKKFKYIFFGMLCVLFPLVITIYGIVYFGGLWDPIGKLNNLKVAVVNQDVGCPPTDNILCAVLGTQMEGIDSVNIGKNIVEGIQNNDQTKNLFDWVYTDNYNEEGAYKIVNDYDRWAVIYIPENFTQNILSQLDKTQFNTPTNKNLILTSIANKLKIKTSQVSLLFDLNKLEETVDATLFYIYDTARSYTSVTFVSTAFETIDRAFKKNIALTLYQKIAGSGKITFNNNFYMNAYVSNFVDIHPINNFGQNFASFMLFIVIYIAAIATNLVYRKYRPFNHYIQKEKTNVSIVSSAIGKILINMLYMIFVSSLMMLVMLMFGNAQHEKSLFCVFLIFVLWAFISLSFGHIISNLLPLLPFLGICVIFLVIQLATCGGIVANQLQPGFWNVGKALPMYYATAEMRYLLFDTGSRYNGRNVLALILWAVGLAIVDCITCFVQLNNVRKAAPLDNEKRDLEKQSDLPAPKRVTKEDIEKNGGDLSNMH